MPFMGLLKQSTQVTKSVLMVDSSDHITGKTGLSAGITKYLSKVGTAASATMTTVEVDATNVKGVYTLVFTTGHTDTLGDFQLHLTATGADPADYWWTVVARLNDDLAYPATTGRSMVVDASGLVDANAVKVGPSGSGTAQTAGDVIGDTNDIQARLPAALTANGNMKSSLLEIMATALTETSGLLAGGFKQFFNVSSPTGTVNSLPNAVAGASGGVFIAGTNAATTVTTALTTTFTGNLTGSVGTASPITSNLKKNQALANFEFLMTDSTNHNPSTGLTVTCTRSIDGGAFASGTLTNVAEVSNGIYRVDFGAGDLNGNSIVLRATAASSDDTFVEFVTQP